MDFKALVRSQLQLSHGTLEQVIGDCDGDVLHHRHPGGTASSVAAIYAHAVLSEDTIVNGMVLGRAPLFASGNWAEKTGVPARPGNPALEDAWDASIKMNLPAFREYAQAVYAGLDSTVAGMSDADAARLVDTPFGTKQPALEFIATLVVAHTWGHLGEIAALKGVRGLKGLPF